MSRPIVLYSESRYPDNIVEKSVYGQDIEVRWRDVDDVSNLDPADCADVAGLAVTRHGVTASRRQISRNSQICAACCAWA